MCVTCAVRSGGVTCAVRSGVTVLGVLCCEERWRRRVSQGLSNVL